MSASFTPTSKRCWNVAVRGESKAERSREGHASPGLGLGLGLGFGCLFPSLNNFIFDLVLKTATPRVRVGFGLGLGLGCDPWGGRRDWEASVKHFRGPCAAYCKPLAPCCCVSADGEAIFGCVPTDLKYFLPACLHMALCPQLGCDPRGGDEKLDYCCGPLIFTLVLTPFLCCLQFTDYTSWYW